VYAAAAADVDTDAAVVAAANEGLLLGTTLNCNASTVQQQGKCDAVSS
jgi:hypothetical protein